MKWYEKVNWRKFLWGMNFSSLAFCFAGFPVWYFTGFTIGVIVGSDLHKWLTSSPAHNKGGHDGN